MTLLSWQATTTAIIRCGQSLVSNFDCAKGCLLLGLLHSLVFRDASEVPTTLQMPSLENNIVAASVDNISKMTGQSNGSNGCSKSEIADFGPPNCLKQ
eukprot:scaffold648026_cov44-Prasinocladus_malaysianus.AAC.2